MRVVVLFLLTAALIFAIDPGTVVAIPGAAPSTVGSVKAISGPVTCIVSGNGYPATAVVVACWVNGTAIVQYKIPLAPNDSYTFSQNFGLDAVCFISKADATGKITVSGQTPGLGPTGVAF